MKKELWFVPSVIKQLRELNSSTKVRAYDWKFSELPFGMESCHFCMAHRDALLELGDRAVS